MGAFIIHPENPLIKLDEESGAFGVYCPGCKKTHVIYPNTMTMVDKKHCWQLISVNPLTIHPSYLTWVDRGPKETHFRCHSFIKDGQWQFLADCTHALKGQTVPMIPFPVDE